MISSILALSPSLPASELPLPETRAAAFPSPSVLRYNNAQLSGLTPALDERVSLFPTHNDLDEGETWGTPSLVPPTQSYIDEL